MNSLPDRQFTSRLRQQIPQNLTVSWLAVSTLYFLGFGILPEPMVALLVSTAVGLIAAVMTSTGVTVPPGVEAAARAAADQRRAPHRALLPSPPASRSSTSQPAPGARALAGPNHLQGRPSSVDVPNVGRSDPAGRWNTEIQNPAAGQVEPTPEPAPVAALPAAAGVEPVDVDLDAYASADPGEIQCPSCGSFAVTVDETSGTARGTVCRHEWSLPVGDSVSQDVIVRSWFSP